MAPSDIGAMLDRARRQDLQSLDEYQSKRLLAAYGVPVPEGVVVQDEEDAIEAATSLNSPVVLKIVGSAVQHKSERGLIALRLEGASAVRAAYRHLVQLAGDVEHRVLVERMLTGPRELMVGMKRDAQFGPVLLFGVGGVFAEAHNDVSLLVTPFEEVDLEAMIEGIRARPLLDGIRGLPPVDRDALAAVITAMAAIAADHPEITEIDVNPLVIEGACPVAADALVILADPGEAPPGLSETRPPLDLQPLFEPRSLAVVGASANPLKWGGTLLASILEGGYAGGVYPVNGRGGAVGGLTAYRSLDETPSRPDLALVAVAADRTQAVVEDCVRRGVPAALIVSAGFSETGPDGASAEAALAASARAGGLTLIGPNCIGLWCSHSRLHAIGFFASNPPSGRISLVSQSGTVAFQLLSQAARRGIGIEKCIAVGNEADTSALDVLDALRGDERTRAVLMYLEGVKSGDRFNQVMRKVTPEKPVVVVRGGLTEPGSRAAASHSGALAGSAEIFMAAARQSGCLVCTDPDEGLDLALCLANMPVMGASRVGVVTLGGGFGVLVADELARCGLQMPAPHPELFSDIDRLLPSYWSRSNPIDLVSTLDTETMKSIVRLVAESDCHDGLIVVNRFAGRHVTPQTPGAALPEFSDDERDFLDWVGDLMDSTGKPIICVSLDPVDRAVDAERVGATAVLLPSPLRAVRAMAGLAQLGAFRFREAQ